MEEAGICGEEDRVELIHRPNVDPLTAIFGKQVKRRVGREPRMTPDTPVGAAPRRELSSLKDRSVELA